MLTTIKNKPNLPTRPCDSTVAVSPIVHGDFAGGPLTASSEVMVYRARPRQSGARPGARRAKP